MVFVAAVAMWVTAGCCMKLWIRSNYIPIGVLRITCEPCTTMGIFDLDSKTILPQSII